jgi:predicted nucleic acid-binding protein
LHTVRNGCLGIVNDAAEFALWLSPHILDNSTRVLMAVVGTPKDEAADYRDILTEIADASGGGTLTPPRTVHDCSDHENNLVLDLAAEVGALLLVSEDIDLTRIWSWRGVPILRASEFTARVDAMRRHQRRKGQR